MKRIVLGAHNGLAPVRFVPAVFLLAAATGLAPAQAQKDSLASLIEAGNRKSALDRIRAGLNRMIDKQLQDRGLK